MGEVLALTAAACYGVTHFGNGLLARRANGVAVAVFAQAGGTVLILILALAVPGGTATGPALGWGALSGVATGLGMAFLYRGLGRGRMSVVVPVSDVNAMTIPVFVGIALLGERPSSPAVFGIGVALPAIWLISRGGRANAEPRLRAARTADGPGTPARTRRAAGVTDGLLGGAGIALTWVALAEVPAGTGLWPLVLSRVVSVAAIIPLVTATRTSLRLPASVTAPAAVVGAVGTVATLLYMLAAREQLLAVTSVLSALYPAIPVLLALGLLGERITAAQTVGLGCAAAAISLIALP
ncbi:MAG: EamA family transporter [Streptosporangiales bacterium]|nr:EamA family transporter [Streptosporangiales bacterium]